MGAVPERNARLNLSAGPTFGVCFTLIPETPSCRRLDQGSPKTSDAETTKQRFVAHQGESLDLGLCDEHAVEGVTMLTR